MRRIALSIGLAALVVAIAVLAYPRSVDWIAVHVPLRLTQTYPGTTRSADVFVAFATDGKRGTLPLLLKRHPGFGTALAKELAPLAETESDPTGDLRGEHLIASFKVVGGATGAHGVQLFALETAEMFVFAGGRLFEGDMAGSFPVRIRLSPRLVPLAIDEASDENGAALPGVMPGWALSRTNGVEADWLFLEAEAGRWPVRAKLMPRLLHLPAPGHPDPVKDDPADIYSFGVLPNDMNGFSVRQCPKPSSENLIDKMSSSPDGRFVRYLDGLPTNELVVDDVQRGRWLVINGPGFASEVPEAQFAWTGSTLVFDVVDVGFSEPRPKVMTKTHVEIDLAAARVTRVVPFGPYTGNPPR